MPLLSYLSVLVWCLNIFWIVFCVRKAILSCETSKILLTSLTSLPQYVKVAHFFFVLVFRVLCLRGCGGTFSFRFALY
jgi:hypothetical protein